MSTFRIAAWAFGLVALALLAGCATGPRISAEADPEADFSRYRTFAFYSPLAIEREGYTSAASERMKAAARREMEARGYVFTSDSPDLWLNINAYTQQRTDVSTMPTVDYAYYYSYRARGYYVVPYWRDRTDVYRYTEGTLNVDLVDAARNRLVWEGIAVGRVTRAKDPATRGARVDGAMADIFAAFPYRAGSVPAPR
jgi:hypothetical protein